MGSAMTSSAGTITITVASSQVARATFRVDLTTIKVGGKSQPQFARSLDTQDHPNATFTLTEPVTLSHAFTSGSAITTTATGQLTMRAASHLVTFTISARHDGALVQAAGSIPIAFSRRASTDHRNTASSPRSPITASQSSSSCFAGSDEARSSRISGGSTSTKAGSPLNPPARSRSSAASSACRATLILSMSDQAWLPRSRSMNGK